MRSSKYAQARLDNAFLVAYRRDTVVKQDFHCKYCFIPVSQKTATVDHVKAKSRGGLNNKENLVVACVDCNKLKSNMSVDDFYIQLKKCNSIPFLLFKFRRTLWVRTHIATYRIKRAAGIKCSQPKFSK